MKMKSIVMLLVCMVVMAAAGPTDKNDDSDMAELNKDQRVCIADHIRADGTIFAGFINILRKQLFCSKGLRTGFLYLQFFCCC